MRPMLGRSRDRDTDHADVAAALNACIGIVATIIVGQLWGVTVALDAWLGGDTVAVWWILGFQALSFAVAVIIWVAAPRD